MDSDRSQSTEKKESIQYKESTGHALTTIPTSVTLSPEQFETLYLTPMTRRQPEFAKRVGNPTPLLVSKYLTCYVLKYVVTLCFYARALGGFVITTTPISCCLMAWRGASGNGVAFM